MNPGLRMRAILLGLAATAASACGADPTALNPAAPSLFVVPVVYAQVAGQWKGVSTLSPNSVTGILGSSAECVGADLAARLGLPAGLSEPIALTVSQDGADVSGRLTTASAVGCSYTGRAGRDSFTMDSASCDALVPVLIRCDNGAVRELELAGSSVSGALIVDANLSTITGTVTNTYNIKDVGSLILKYSYYVNRNQQ